MRFGRRRPVPPRSSVSLLASPPPNLLCCAVAVAAACVQRTNEPATTPRGRALPCRSEDSADSVLFFDALARTTSNPPLLRELSMAGTVRPGRRPGSCLLHIRKQRSWLRVETNARVRGGDRPAAVLSRAARPRLLAAEDTGRRAPT